MKYRVLEKIVGDGKPAYYVQRREGWIFPAWFSICAYENKESAINIAKEFEINSHIKTKVIYP